MSLTLTPKQSTLVDQIVAKDQAVIIAPTGSGKTTTLLHVILKRSIRFIVACPPKVINTWQKEIKKWGLHLTITPLVGNPQRRLKLLGTTPDILVVSLNNLDWLLAQNHGCSGIVVDELSKAAGRQTRALKTKKTQSITIRYGMTATPVSENFEKLFGMYRIIDQGKALGTRKDSYMNKYFYALDFKGYNMQLRQGMDKEIMKLISPITVSLDYKKHEELPPKQEHEIVFDLPEKTRQAYLELKKEMLLENDTQTAIASNAAVLTSKLRQLSSGFILDIDKTPLVYDTKRAEVAAKFIKDHTRILVIYEYDYQREQLAKALHDTPVGFVYGDGDEAEISWFMTGEVDILIAQKKTLSHGVDGLQNSCSNILFYQPIWSKDENDQIIGRIWRQGQTEETNVYYLIAEDTLDDAVLARIEDKGRWMNLFMEHLKND